MQQYAPPAAKLSLRQRLGYSLARTGAKMLWGRASYSGNAGGYSGLVGQLLGLLPGASFDYARAVGDPALNSAVNICLNWIADQFPEPVLEAAYHFRTGNTRPIADHPAVALIEDPNEYYDGDCLWRATVVDYSVDGNAYWYKARGTGGKGSVRELYHLPYWQIVPRWESADAEVSFYEYRVDGEAIRFERDEIIHFRDGKDPYRRGKGASRLRQLLREIFSDTQAAAYTAGILNNMGVPGCILQPKLPTGSGNFSPIVGVDRESREQLQSMWQQFTSDGAGLPLIPSVPLEVLALGVKPGEMDLGVLNEIPVKRICAALRLPPEVVSLGAGDGKSSFDNGGQHAEARRAAYQECILPLQKSFAKTLNRSLMPEFDAVGSEARRRVFLCWNYDNVEALAEDRDALHKCAREDYQKGLLTRNEARELIGLCRVQDLPEEDQPEESDTAGGFIVPKDAQQDPQQEAADTPGSETP